MTKLTDGMIQVLRNHGLIESGETDLQERTQELIQAYWDHVKEKMCSNAAAAFVDRQDDEDRENGANRW